MKYYSLSLVKFVWYNRAISTFLWLMFAWYIFFFCFTLNLCVSLYFKCVSYTQYVVGSYSFFQLDNFCLFIRVFRVFICIFNVIIVMIGFKSIILLFVFNLSHLFFVSFSSFGFISFLKFYLCPLLAYQLYCTSEDFFKRFYLFIERGEGKEKERERNINVWLSLTCPLLGTWPTTQACVLTENRTGDPLVCGPCSMHWATPARAEDFNIYFLL